MTSIASIEAYKLWNCEIYYMFSSEYDPYGIGPRHKGKLYIKKPITFPIKKPKEVFLKTLKIIKDLIKSKYNQKYFDSESEQFIFMKKLIDVLESKHILELKSKHKELSSRKSALYMKSYKFLEPLVRDLKYIKISEDKRNKKVFLTQRGKDILKIFKFLI